VLDPSLKLGPGLHRITKPYSYHNPIFFILFTKKNLLQMYCQMIL
jgi:hypothetical protein